MTRRDAWAPYATEPGTSRCEQTSKETHSGRFRKAARATPRRKYPACDDRWRYNPLDSLGAPRMVETSSCQFADVIVAAPVGRVDHHSVSALEAALMPLVKDVGDSKGVLVLDFAGIDYISSVGLRILMIAAKDLRAAGAKIAVANLKPVVAEIFAISRFDRVLGVFSTVRDAIGQFSPAALVAFDRARPPAAR